MSAIGEARLLVIDDDPELLEVLQAWLGIFGCHVDTALNGLAALSLARRNHYDVVITDLQMPSLNGLQLLPILKSEVDPAPEVIFLTGQGTMDDAIAALREGQAFDFLRKPLRDFNQLKLVIERALERRARPRGRAPQPAPCHVQPLSERERDIIRLLSQGLDNRLIADRLCLSEKTVKNHLTRIYSKLGVGSRTQAVLDCQRYGLID